MPEPQKIVPPAEEKPLPLFRQDLRLFPGPTDPDGSPTYSLFDPVRAQYFRITWTEYQVMTALAPRITISQLITAIESRSTLKVTKEEIMRFFEDAAANNLLAIFQGSDKITDKAEKQKSGFFVWLLYHYLYFRVPVINPDKFLGKTIKYVMPLVSPVAIYLYCIIFVLGLFELITGFDEFLHTFPYFFTLVGGIAYALGITCVKIIHEFAHAYTAKYYKLYVPTMGVAFIVFWPVLYTDVTDGWKIAKRSKRIAISFAGIGAELTIAGMSTLGWALTSPGMLQSVFFIISSATWISTLAVNMNPALRFDGYYILCDLWGIDNLQSRAFATTRWKMRKWLLGIDVEPPEENLSTGRVYGMMVYTFYTWIYRLFLYTAIAILVYNMFTKALGIFLFILEIGVFILWPLLWEAQQISRLRGVLTFNRRSVTTLTVLILLFLWAVIPLPHRESFPAITIPNADASQAVYVPYPSKVKAIYVQRGDLVHKGQPIVQLASPELETQIVQSQLEKASAEREIVIASQSEKLRPQIGEKVASVNALAEKIGGLQKLNQELTILAEISGMVYTWDESVKVGQAVGRDQILGKIADLANLQILVFVPETNLSDIYEGQPVVFRRRGDLAKFSGRIVKINLLRTQTLTHPQLASINHGDLPVANQPQQQPGEKKQEELKLVESYYTAYVELDKPHADLKLEEVGEADVRGPWRSMAMTLWRKLHSLFWREGSI